MKFVIEKRSTKFKVSASVQYARTPLKSPFQSRIGGLLSNFSSRHCIRKFDSLASSLWYRPSDPDRCHSCNGTLAITPKIGNDRSEGPIGLAVFLRLAGLTCRAPGSAS